MRAGQIVTLDEALVRAGCEQATTQEEYLVAIYRLVFPDWDAIVSVDVYPACNTNTWEAICRLAMDADKRRLGLNVVLGGAWLSADG